MAKFIFFILLITNIFNYQLRGMEKEEPKKRDLFLAFNSFYHLSLNPPKDLSLDRQQVLDKFSIHYAPIYHLPGMPHLRETLKKASQAADQYNIEEYKQLTHQFLEELENCNPHIASYPNLLEGKKELLRDCQQGINYIKSIESQMQMPQSLLNNALIKTIKTNSKNLARIKELLEQGASPNSRDLCTGNTALTAAINSFDIEIIKLLIQHRADLDLKNDCTLLSKATKTPLIAIAYKINFLNSKQEQDNLTITKTDILKQILFLLLRNGADPTIPDETGKTVAKLIPTLLNAYRALKNKT